MNGYAETVESLTRYSSPELVASLLLSARQELADERRRNRAEVQRLLGLIDGTGRIGMRVLVAQQAGRKTVRIADLVEGP